MTTATPQDHAGLEIIDPVTLWELLRTQPVGRVAFVLAGEPVILPVNYTVDGRTILFRTGFGAKLDAAAVEMPAAFEVDSYDRLMRTGWSVLLRGWLSLDPDAEAEVELSTIDPWVDGASRPYVVRFFPTETSGRRIPDGP